MQLESATRVGWVLAFIVMFCMLRRVTEAGFASALMNEEFPSAVPEIPVNDVIEAVSYYENCLGFQRQGGAGGGFGQVCRGSCRIFLTDSAFREQYGPIGAPVVIWINLNNKKEVDELYEAWKSRGARIVSGPESKPWHLHEFTVADPDGNLLRVFYDFAWELRD